MKKLIFGLLLLISVSALAANWHNKTDGSFCLEASVGTGDVFCTDGSGFDFTATASEIVNILTGNLKVGNGSPSVSLNGEDAYIEGTFEVDGTSNLAGAVTMGSTASVGGALTLENSESVNTNTDAAFDFTRNDAGAVTLTASDNDATAALTVDPGGAAALTLGSADVTSITAIVDTDFTHQNGTSGNVTVDYRDYADTADDDMAHAIVTVNCTDATTGAEDCDYSVGVVEGGAAAESRLSIDADGGMTLGSANNNSLTVTTDGTGTGEVVLPTGSVSGTEITDSTLLAADDTYPGRGVFSICGDAVTVNNNTVYYGQAVAMTDSATVGGPTCNTDATGNTTEASADEIVLTNTAIYPLGMVCYTTDQGATVTYTLRSAEAAVTPAISISIADNELSGATSVSATSAIAAGATVAIAVASTADVATTQFRCNVNYAF